MARVLTAEYVRDRLSYDPCTGQFIWLKNYHTRLVGQVAGSIFASGYRYIRIADRAYRAHRLAWFYMHGVWPTEEVDHIDGNRDNNRFDNLRLTTRRQNSQNKAVHRAGQLYGASYYKPLKKWRAAIQINKQVRHIGYFDTELEAHEAYKNACKTIVHEVTI